MFNSTNKTFIIWMRTSTELIFLATSLITILLIIILIKNLIIIFIILLFCIFACLDWYGMEFVVDPQLSLDTCFLFSCFLQTFDVSCRYSRKSCSVTWPRRRKWAPLPASCSKREPRRVSIRTESLRHSSPIRPYPNWSSLWKRLVVRLYLKLLFYVYVWSDRTFTLEVC